LAPILAVWAAGLAALVTHRLLPVARARSSSAAARAALMQQRVQDGPSEWYLDLVRAFEPLARRLPSGRRASVARALYWAQLAGAWRQWDELSFWSLCLALGLSGAVAGTVLFGASAMAAVTAGLALYAPVMLLSGHANRVQRRFLRELPEMVELLRLEVASGASLSQAFAGLTDDVTPASHINGGWNPTEVALTGSVRDVAAGNGYVALWLRRVMRLSTGTGIFAAMSGGDDGVMLEEARRSGLPELITLAVQLDIIARRGSDPGPLLDALAGSVAQEYQASMDRQAERIAGELIFPTFAFFFVPFLVAMLAPVAMSFLSSGGL
jgi:hypothetical protein